MSRAEAIPSTQPIDPVQCTTGAGAEQLHEAYERVRRFTETLCAPLAVEDHVIQTAEEVSPAKWHLAHVSWFFEQFILTEHLSDYQPCHPTYFYLFNSYYNGAGPQHCRPNRGLISRPTVAEVHEYRRYIDQHMHRLIDEADADKRARLQPLITLGLNHEQQHQELIVTDIKHIFSTNPLLPAYEEKTLGRHAAPPPARWVGFPEGVYEIGLEAGRELFHFDNETPRHRVFLEPFEIADRLVTNGEYMRFIEDGGYQRPELWLSEGWATVSEQNWRHPIYWYKDPGQGGRWMHYTLAGPQPVDEAEPVAHLSYFEAEAFARWAGARLPSEPEWEVAVGQQPIEGNFADHGRLHPRPLDHTPGERELAQAYGDVWEWTGSQYLPYPGYEPLAGTLGEYNGKFMCNQFVLRGGSCATSRSHLRRTYRNFFFPAARWQYTGLRLAK